MTDDSWHAVNESERILDTLKANGRLERLLQESLVLLRDDADFQKQVHVLVSNSKTLQKNPKGRILLASLKEEVEGELMTLAMLKLWEKMTSKELAKAIESSIQMAIVERLKSGGK